MRLLTGRVGVCSRQSCWSVRGEVDIAATAIGHNGNASTDLVWTPDIVADVVDRGVVELLNEQCDNFLRCAIALVDGLNPTPICIARRAPPQRQLSVCS
ncbi:hypothetical protein [Nocardia sp. NBC_00403]|uniref:hypothetical protein n=1 Tax=Nocardia sp. NBC_00403 TaxID=2975990 RepID=UPI002E20CB0D